MNTFSFTSVLRKSLGLFLLLTVTTLVHSQSYEQFLRNEGVATLAALAHPTNVFQRGSYRIYDDAVVIDIHYKGNIRTKVRLDVKNGVVTGVHTLSDNDWFPAFLGIELMKDLLYELSRDVEQSQQVAGSYEKWLNKAVYEFSGKEMAMLILTLSWIGY